MKRVLVIHGWSNRRDPDHWQHRLVSALRNQGHQVMYPQLPNTENPVVDEWLEVAAAELEMLQELGTDELIVIGHSLGCLTWMHLVMRGLVPEIVDRVLLVAPADPDLCEAAVGFPLELGDDALKQRLHAAAGKTTILASDADPWIPRGVQQTFSDVLEFETVLLPGAAHLAMQDGWGPWQGVIDWVNDSGADLSHR